MESSDTRESTAVRPKHGEFMWHELLTRDDGRAVSFFEQLLGWKRHSIPLSKDVTYHLMTLGQATVGGVFRMFAPQFPPDLPPHWLSYIAVDDVDARFQRALELGGQAVHPPSDVPNLGRISIIKDPTGATVALVTPEGGIAES